MPFDLIVSVDELGRKYEEGRILLVPFRSLEWGMLDPIVRVLSAVVRFGPLGLLLALLPLRPALNWRTVLAIGLDVTACIECLQLVVFTRFFAIPPTL
jgi:glycopeptide antibiotics resistance protein